MMRPPWWLFLLGATGAGLAAQGGAGCVTILGDFEQTTGAGQGGSAAGSSTTTSVGGGTAGSGGSAECDAGLSPCGPSCIDTQTTATDCGTCGHDCGGGLCQQGHCQPVTLHDGLDTVPYGVAAAGNAVFWARVGAVESCPAAGCGANPPTVVNADATTGGAPLTGTTIVSDGNFVEWLAYDPNMQSPGYPGPVMYGCHAAGCGGQNPTLGSATSPMAQLALVDTTLYASIGNPGGMIRTCTIGSCSGDPLSTYIASSGVDTGFGIVADAAFVYFTAGNDPVLGGAIKCPLAGCPTPASSRIQLFGHALFLAIVDGTLYSATTDDTIVGCDAINGCGGQPNVLASSQVGITAFVADGDRLFFAIGGSTDSADGELRACALPDCAGGPTPLVSGEPRPVSLAVRDGFLYWANAGLAGQTTTTAAIRRVRL